MKTRLLTGFALALAAPLSLPLAQKAHAAEVLTLSYVSSAPGVSGLSVSGNNGPNPTNTATTSYAGEFKWNVVSDTGGNTFGGATPITPMYTFCIQLGQFFSTSQNNVYTVASLNSGAPIGGWDAGYIDSLAAAQIQGLTDSYYSLVGGTLTLGPKVYTANDVAAAFQLSLWEIEYDGGTGRESFGSTSNYFSSGNTYNRLDASGTGAGQDAITLANYFLNNFTADSVISSYALESGSPGNRQDQFVGVPNPGGGSTRPTPLPAALPGGLLLIGSLGAARHLRKKA